jgi:hypothetical protein
VQYKYAAQIFAHTRSLEHHVLKLQHLHAKINAEATAIAGADFANHHTLGFDEYKSFAVQQTDNEGSCSVEGAGIVDVIDMANTMANHTDRVAACHVPPALSPERHAPPFQPPWEQINIKGFLNTEKERACMGCL